MPIIMINDIKDFYISLNNTYASLCMASLMVISMKLIMDIPINILVLNLVIFILSLLALRNQYFVNDTFYLRDMIPHHSMAILTSKHIQNRTKNPKIKELAKNILETQQKEIMLMKNYF